MRLSGSKSSTTVTVARVCSSSYSASRGCCAELSAMPDHSSSSLSSSSLCPGKDLKISGWKQLTYLRALHMLFRRVPSFPTLVRGESGDAGGQLAVNTGRPGQTYLAQYFHMFLLFSLLGFRAGCLCLCKLALVEACQEISASIVVKDNFCDLCLACASFGGDGSVGLGEESKVGGHGGCFVSEI